MDIKEKIHELECYFVNKITSGDFKLVSADNNTADILIDEKYYFSLWIYGDKKSNLDFNSSAIIKSMNPFNFKIRGNQTRIAAWQHLEPMVDNYYREQLKVEKQKKIDLLKKEIQLLNESQ